MRKIYNLLLLSTLLLSGASNVWAVTVNGGTFYFDNALTQWSKTHTYLVVGKDSWGNDYSDTYDMSPISHTTLYYKDMSAWSGATYVAVMANTDEFGSGKWGSSNVSNAEKYTACYTGDYSFNYGTLNMLTPSGASNGSSITVTYVSGVDKLNECVQTIGIKVDETHSGTFTELTASDEAVATISGTGYTFGAYNACNTAANASLTAGTDYATIEVGGGYRAYVKLSYSDVADDYAFIGWYDKDGKLLSSSNNYEYYPDAAAEVYAYFRPTTYSRTVTSGNYGTICLPGAVSAITGAKIYEVAGYRGTAGAVTSVVLTDEVSLASTPLTAGKPYIFKATASTIVATYTGAFETAPKAGANGLVGKFTEETIDDNDATYILRNNKIYLVEGDGVTCSANRAFFNFSGMDPYTAPGVREIPFAPAEATNIENIDAAEDGVKFMQNGKLFIMKNGVVYDMMGAVVK